jgi:FKBP-type peptidyl-prolyl cis-trans isomerase FkpA
MKFLSKLGLFASTSVLIFCMGCGSDPSTQAKTPQAPPNEGPSDPDAPSEFTTTGTGLKFKILRKSDLKKPTPTNSVTVHYRGWLDNGNDFDNSYIRNEPATFQVMQVVPGWIEGLQLVGEGGKIELEIPSHLGYGARGAPPDIPANATLHFIVELIKVH